MKSIFIQKLSYLLDTSHVNQKDISEAIGISKQKMSNLKSGYTAPNIADLVQISKFFQVSTDFLLGCTDEQGNKHFPDAVTSQIDAIISKLKSSDKKSVLDYAEWLVAREEKSFADADCYSGSEYIPIRTDTFDIGEID